MAVNCNTITQWLFPGFHGFPAAGQACEPD